MRRLSPALVSTALAATLLTACGSVGSNPTGPGSSSPTQDHADRAKRAADLADRYAKAGGGSPALDLGEQLEQQDADWEPAVGENAKLAWLTGHLVQAAPLPAAPGKGKSLNRPGAGVSGTVISAGDALAAMTARRTDCGGCTDLRVTGAELTTMDVRTSAGQVQVPAWRFSLEGTAVRLLRVALPASGLVRTPVDWSPAPGDGQGVESFELGGGGRTLTLTFTGKPAEPGACGGDYRGEAFESDRAVVVTVLEVPREPTGQDIACAAIGAIRTVDVRLDRALGDRTVLSLADGRAVQQGSARPIGQPVR
ncbi:hypothetical protein SAMN04489867_0524 [Pedococcus dokdonensis]|uniref:Lipoprotein n=2 Tax=Pedococcus dokdonensis TaxID=443156 RepID=A0A1H0M8D8_9MICO|nr:hypothetical protein SAMN04489867_0524 [Pedococcus dokdonensis]